MISHGYLFRSSPGGEEHVSHVSWDEDHGGESHEPADPLAPCWEHVVIHFKRNHLDGAEQKDSLKKRRRLRWAWERGFLEIPALWKSSSSNSGFVYGSNGYAADWPDLMVQKLMREWMWYCAVLFKTTQWFKNCKNIYDLLLNNKNNGLKKSQSEIWVSA